MHIFKRLYFLKKIVNFLFTNLVTCFICFVYWFCTAASRCVSSKSIRIVLFKTSHLHLRLRLRRNYFLGLRKRLRREIFREFARALAAQLFWLALPPLAVRYNLLSIPPFLIPVTKTLLLLFLLHSYCDITNRKLESIHTSQLHFKFLAFNSLIGLIISEYFLNEI